MIAPQDRGGFILPQSGGPRDRSGPTPEFTLARRVTEPFTLHHHAWVTVGEESSAGSTLLACVQPACAEIRYRLRG